MGLALVGASVFAARTGAQQAPVHAPATFAGCYRISLGAWTPPLKNAAFHAIPATIRLDTIAAARGGWVVSPDIARLRPHRFPGFPRWIERGDSLEIAWSDGFQVTRMLVAHGGSTELRGRAVAESDYRVAGKVWPGASVIAARIDCATNRP